MIIKLKCWTDLYTDLNYIFFLDQKRLSKQRCAGIKKPYLSPSAACWVASSELICMNSLIALSNVSVSLFSSVTPSDLDSLLVEKTLIQLVH